MMEIPIGENLTAAAVLLLLGKEALVLLAQRRNGDIQRERFSLAGNGHAPADNLAARVAALDVHVKTLGQEVKTLREVTASLSERVAVLVDRTG